MVTDLPNNLKIPSNITYIQGTNGVWEPEFESDFDKAVYYAGKSPNPRSKNQKNVIKWIYSLGVSFDEIKDHRKKILAKLKNLTTKDGAWEDYPNVLVPPVFQSFSIEQDEEDDEMPEGLDDLLKDVGRRDTPEPPGALSTIPKKPDDLVDEEIDSQILSILGLEDVFDLTYEEYASLLKEAAIKGRMADSQMTTESIELVTNELKRVKGKTGKFKVKEKKVNIDKVFNRRPGAIVRSDKLRPETQTNYGEEVKNENLQNDVVNGIGRILDSLLVVKKSLVNQNKIEEKGKELDRIENENQKKRNREEKLEKKKKIGFTFPRAISAPITSFFDSIINYFKNLLYATVILKLYEWLKKPGNKEKVLDFVDTIKDQSKNILKGLLAIIALRIGWKIFKFVRRLYKAYKWIKTKLPGGAPKTPKTPKPPKPQKPQSQNRFQRRGGKYYTNPQTGARVRYTPQSNSRLSRFNDSYSRVISGNANLGDKLRVGFRNLKYKSGKYAALAWNTIKGSVSFVKNKIVPPGVSQWAAKNPGVVNGIKSANPMPFLGKLLRVIGLAFLISELNEDYKNRDIYAIIVKLAAYGAGWIVTALGFLAGAALTGVTAGFGSAGGIAIAVASMAAGYGTDAAIRSFLLARRPDGAKTAAEVKPVENDSKLENLRRKIDRKRQRRTEFIPNQSLLPPLPPTNTLPGQQYGARRQNNDGTSRFHAGVDFDADLNDKFYSRIGGEVTKVGDDPGGYYKYVDIYNKDLNVTERIAEGDSILVSEGQMVSPGDAIAQGTSKTGVFHYEIRKGKKTTYEFSQTLNPIDFLNSVSNISTESQRRRSKAKIRRNETNSLGIDPPVRRDSFGKIISIDSGGSKASSPPAQKRVSLSPIFSSVDPNNTTIMVVKSIYNVVG